METTAETTNITIETTIQAPVEKVWKFWTSPQHITQWNNASEEWHTPRAENDLQVGGQFVSRMEAKDGSMGFDFKGTYTDIQEHQFIAYTLEDGRKVQIQFNPIGNATTVTETFAAEQTHPIEMQRTGWQAILDNFKKYVEASAMLVPLHFEINIQAKAEKVYHTMLDEKLYTAWTAVFSPASHYIGSWEKGSKIWFLGEDKDGKTGGMVSKIVENIPNQFVSIQNLGFVQNGNEITSGSEVQGWSGAMENYTFSEENGTTKLSIYVDSNLNYKDYFMETWPKALEKLKALCEN